jgi:hypothetical protein
MTGTSWTRRKIAFLVAGAISLGVTGLLSIAMAYPRPVVSALGPDWQCHRIVIMTSCTRLEQMRPVADRASKGITMPRGV